MKKIDVDDKLAVIICVTAIGIISMFKLADSATIVNSVVSGLFGVAVGKGLSKH